MNLEHAEIIAERLMDQYGLTAKNWKFEWDKANSRAGCCHFLGGKRITLSRSITKLNPRTHLVDTMLHEIAHALAGPGHGHDEHWKGIARKIGCIPTRCYTAQTRVPCAAMDCLLRAVRLGASGMEARSVRVPALLQKKPRQVQPEVSDALQTRATCIRYCRPGSWQATPAKLDC